MSEQQIDLFEGRRLRDEGIRAVAENNESFLDSARATAAAICRQRGRCTADDVKECLALEPAHPNAWGALFKDGQFEHTGEFRQSRSVSRRAGVVRVWRLKKWAS
tara:strand:- start:14533 stop:14847 length:315 start_codon:yes stop_codon:yes gene_type:complete